MWQVLIGGRDFTQYVDLPSLEIDSYLDPKTDTCQFTVTYPRGTLSRPLSRNELVIYNGTNPDGSPHREFGGVIIEVDDISDKPGVATYQVKARDYSPWLDRQAVVEALPIQNADVSVKYLIGKYAPLFTTNHVTPSFPLTQMYLNYSTLTDALQKISDLAQYIWYVDYYKDIHFGPMDAVPMPTLPNNTLNLDTMPNWYGNLQITDDGTTIRNQIYLKGFEVSSSNQITRTITANGVDNVFPLLYKPARPVNKSCSVTVGGVAYTVKSDMEGGMPGLSNQPGVAYINRQNLTVRFDTAPASGTQIVVTMYYAYNPVVAVRDPVSQREIASREGNGTGEYDWVITDSQLVSDDVSLAQDMGQAAISKWAYPHYTAQFDSYQSGWQAGQYFTMQSSVWMDGFDGAGSTTMYVLQVKKTIVENNNGQPLFKSTITCADSPYVYTTSSL